MAIVLGAEVGHDFPGVAANLRVLSQIFLRLIRTIVAPLLFATLVVGIAGHSNLKQVGRMGIKSLIYFEVVTTLALAIGWVAITLSQAGVGIALPATAAPGRCPPRRRATWQDVVLDIFPDNIARSVAEAHILQVVVFSVLFGIALAMLPDAQAQADAGLRREPGGDDVRLHAASSCCLRRSASAPRSPTPWASWAWACW